MWRTSLWCPLRLLFAMLFTTRWQLASPRIQMWSSACDLEQSTQLWQALFWCRLRLLFATLCSTRSQLRITQHSVASVVEELEESFREACSVLVLFAVALRGAKLYAVAPRISQNCAASLFGDVVSTRCCKPICITVTGHLVFR